MEIPKNIFKAYDIRGIYGEQLTNKAAKIIAKSLSVIYKKNNNKIVVGRDGRLSSFSLSKYLIEGFLESGKDVIDIGEVPTPLLYFAINHFNLNSGVMVTGSHNPKNYNGFKIIMNGSALLSKEIEKIYKNILKKNFNTSKPCVAKLQNVSICEQYINTILKNIKINRKLKISIDAGNGVSGPVALNVFKNLGLEVIDLYCNIDGNFPNHHPNPSDPKNLCDLILSVKKNKCDLGIAFDGDGDRCLIIDNLGGILWPDKQMMVYSKDILSRNNNASIVYDVKSSRDLPIYITKYDGVPVLCRTGHTYIKKKMMEIGALLGGELSGHIFFNDRWFGFDDGIYTGARMLEILSNDSRSSSKIFSELPKSHSTTEINIFFDKDGIQHDFMKNFIRKAKFTNAEIIKIDGLRVDYKNGWGLLRASNTMPCVVMRFEADTKKNLSIIKSNFINEILKIDSSLEIPNEKDSS